MEQSKKAARGEAGSRKSFKLETAAIVILAPFIIVLFLMLWLDSSGFNQPGAGETARESSAINSAGPTVIESQTNKNETADSKKQRVGDAVLLTVENLKGSSRYQVGVGGNETVAEVMRKAADRQELRYDFTDYGGDLGILVTEVNGLSNNDQSKMYWYLYVNGEAAQVGASAAAVKVGDEIEWRYEKIHED